MRDGLGAGFEVLGRTGAAFEGTANADAAFRDVIVAGPLLDIIVGFMVSSAGFLVGT